MFWGEFWPQLIATLIGLCLGIPITLFATFLGALLGVWGALLLDRRQENLKRLEDKQEEEKRKQKILVTLRSTLVGNKGSIERWQTELRLGDEKEYKLYFTLPSENTWIAFREGGELACINDPDLLSQLSGAFSMIGHVRFITETVYGKLISSPYEDIEKSVWYKGQLDELYVDMCERILEKLDDTIKTIDAELSK